MKSYVGIFKLVDITVKNRPSTTQRNNRPSYHCCINISLKTKALIDSDLQHSYSKQMINRIPYSIHLFRVSYSLTETFDRTQSFRLSACLHLCTIDGAFFYYIWYTRNRRPSFAFSIQRRPFFY